MANRVLILTSENFPYGGAASNFLRLLTEGFSIHGLKVTVSILKGYKYGSEINSDKKGVHENIVYHYLSFKNRSANKLFKITDDIFGIIRSLILLINFRFVKGHKSIFIYIDRGYRGFFPILLSYCLGLRTYGVIVEGYDNTSVHLFIKLDNWIKYKINNKLFTGLVVLSNYLASLYKENYSGSSIFLQPNLLNLDTFREIEKKEYTRNSTIRFGYSGVPTQQKDGINDLLEAFLIFVKIKPDSELLIIGDSLNGTLLPKLQSFVDSRYISDKVIFTGLQSHKEISNLLHSCDILVLTRPDNSITRAGFPTKLGEYLACKKPVLLTSFGDIPFYFQDWQNAAITEPGNHEMIAKKMEQLINNKESWERIGLNGYNWAKDNLEYRMATKRLIDFFGL